MKEEYLCCVLNYLFWKQKWLLNGKTNNGVMGQRVNWSPPWQTPLDSRQARSFSCVQRPRDHHLQLLHVVVVVEQGVLVVDLEVLEAEGDEALPEVVLDGEHAVLGPAVDCWVAEGWWDASLGVKEVLDESLSGLNVRLTTLKVISCGIWQNTDEKKKRGFEPVLDNLAGVLLPHTWPQLQHPWKLFTSEFKTSHMLTVSLLHQNRGGKISLGLRSREISWVLGNLSGVADGYPNTSRVLVEYGHYLHW